MFYNDINITVFQMTRGNILEAEKQICSVVSCLQNLDRSLNNSSNMESCVKKDCDDENW